MEEHFKLLGFKARDVVTGFEGVVESISFDLYGCVQAVLRPSLDKAKPAEVPDGRWFDLKRLVAVGKQAVMPIPDFVNVPGGTEKPAFSSQLSR